MNKSILNQDLDYIYGRFVEKVRIKDSTVLLTGCAGFLGYTLMQFFCTYFEELRLRAVIGVDNFKVGKPRWIEKLQSSNGDRVRIHHFDIVTGNFKDIPGVENADYVLHMASIASPTYYRQFPLETVEANVWGLKRLLDFYRERPIKGLLFFSSSEVYGDPFPEFIPTREDYRGNVATMGPRSCYDEAKRFGETLCYIYANQFGMPVPIVRPFNNYGPGMKIDDKRVPADFARAVLENRDIVLFSDGTPQRTFCYVADAVIGYLKALTFGSFDYFNIGIEKPEISIRDLAEIFLSQGRRLAGYKGKIKFETSGDSDYLTHNPSRRCPDIVKAREKLGYHPEIEVEAGVARFIEFMQQEGGNL